MARGRKAKKEKVDDWVDAPAVERVAAQLIPGKFEHLQQTGVYLRYVFTNKKILMRGRVKAAQAIKMTGLGARMYFREFFGRDNDLPGVLFVVKVNKQQWEWCGDREKEALVFHELCHFAAEQKTDNRGNEVLRLFLYDHDIEAFGREVDEYGLWTRNLAAFGEHVAPHVKQLAMRLDEPKPPKPVRAIRTESDEELAAGAVH